LRYKIKDIPDEGLVVDQPIEPKLLGEALDGMGAEPARSAAAVRLELTVTEDDVFVRGNINATLGLPCSLCLQPARLDLSIPVNMIYRPEEPDEESDDVTDDLEVAVHDGKTIDLEPMIREQLILSVPMSVRCKETCLGLCSVCGQDKNVRDCGHAPEREESPLYAAFKDLKV
jgi:uncharacterized protein